jgi:putative mRNA 3-end processing factor
VGTPEIAELRMFHYDFGLTITRCSLAVDHRRRRPRAFVSHAHSDHMARHEWAIATPGTAALYRHRLGSEMRVRELPFGQSYTLGDVALTPYAAGHCLGSAMLLADDGHERLLYTGDFKLAPSLTSEPIEPVRADILIMESTFGDPRYCLPPREVVIERLLEAIDRAFARDQVPVVMAYALGKAQEVTAILARAGHKVVQHPTVAGVSQVYRRQGVELGGFKVQTGEVEPGEVLVTLPRAVRDERAGGRRNMFSIAVSGWAMHPSTRYRLGADLALPLSDHADFNELVEFARQVEPDIVYTTHGPAEFADHLRDAGLNARPLVPEAQRRLFC